jgi:pimeloyl-ACP methyl ester carboxylesterase
MLRWIFLALFIAALAGGAWLYATLTERSGPVDAEARCHVGAYELADGTHAVIIAYDDGQTLEYYLEDGTRDLMQRQSPGLFAGDGIRFQHYECRSPAALWQRAGGEQKIRKIEFDERTVHFKNAAVELTGKLVLPLHEKVGQIVVWVAGSNDDGEIDRTHWQYTLPLDGIGSFMLDKRGTGESQGSVTANFHTRAADVRAAIAQVRHMMAPAMVEVGVHGASQGGWVAPLAALGTDADFVLVSYGLAEGVPAEDRDEMAAYVKKAGYGPDALAKLRTLTDITAKIVRSHWQNGWDALAAWRSEHGNEPWIGALPDTSYTGFLLKIPNFATATVGRIIGPLLDKGISFDYEPRPTLTALKVPQLWLLGGQDISAPSTATIAILREIQSAGAPIDIAVFPNAGHGLLEEWPQHARKRLAPGYREMVAAWVKTRDRVLKKVSARPPTNPMTGLG